MSWWLRFSSAGTNDSQRWPVLEAAHGFRAVRFGDDLGAPKKGLRLSGDGDIRQRAALGVYGTPYT